MVEALGKTRGEGPSTNSHSIPRNGAVTSSAKAAIFARVAASGATVGSRSSRRKYECLIPCTFYGEAPPGVIPRTTVVPRSLIRKTICHTSVVPFSPTIGTVRHPHVHTL